MLIPELPTPREEPVPDAPDSEEDSGANLGDVVVPFDSPTVHRSSNSSARRRLALSSPSVSRPASLPAIGELVDTFLIEEAIGVGGMGAVFRALDTKLDRQVALKLLPPDQASDADIVPRFYQEGRSAAQLDHENIARVYSIGHDGPYHYIAFEYIDGETVRQRVEAAGSLPVADAVNIALQIAHALVHASVRGVVHRDIKPSNIIITPAGRAKLVDMGLARRFERGGDHGLTQSGMTLGSFDYISPEQARDPRDVDVRSDLYSLGCTLFHMLSGRPPFPGGTVLQKLIQHQEEAPADVRTLNPAVPAELAAIIARLMAKDRDRRYQTPENLVRDLLVVAGSVGAAAASSPLPSWLDEAHRHAWERHLVWFVPVAALFLVVAGLGWWGREPSKPSLSAQRSIGPTMGLRPPEPTILTGTAALDSSPSSAAGEAGAVPSNSVAAYPRNIPVSSNEDLLEILATAPRRSVIVLADDGPYRLGGRTWSSRSTAPLANRDLTIKAEPGVRPIIKFATDVSLSDHPRHSLLRFVGGHVAIEGVEFELDAVLPDELVAAVQTEDAELTVRGCSFRRTNSRDGRNVAAIQLRSIRPLAAGDRPPAVVADSCHFDGGQTGILAEGPVDIVLRDCTMGPGQPSIWFDNARSSIPVFSELRIKHASIMAGSEPVFRLDRTQTRAWVEDTVVAPAGRSPATLVMVDDSRNLVWRGRSNLYSRIGVFLGFSTGDDRQESIDDFAHWSETPTELRETGTALTSNPVWETPDPGQALLAQTDNPSRVFLMSAASTSRSDLGARQGPFGSVLTNVRNAEKRSRPEESLASSARPIVREQVGRQATESADVSVPTTVAGEPRAADIGPMPIAQEPPADEKVASSSDNSADVPTMPPMATAGQPNEDLSATGTGSAPLVGQAPAVGGSTAARNASDLARADRDRRPAFEDEDVIRSAEQFSTMLNRRGRQGGKLRIAAGADLDLGSIVIDGTGPYQITAESGSAARRPRLRLRASTDTRKSPADWTALLDLRSGSLHVQGIDLVVPDQDIPRADRLAVAGVLPGTELTMTDCTLTLAANRPGAALLVVQPLLAARNSPAADAGGAVSSAVVRLRDCFLRSGGEGITVAAGRKVDVHLTNVLVSTEGSLLRAFGGGRSGRADSPALKVRLDQVSALVRGGLVHLDNTGTSDGPELPFTAMEADNSILSTSGRDVPLFRLDGRDQRDELVDKVHWSGRKVAYDRIQTYRRDEVFQIGGSPKIYNRANWTTAFSPTDESPMVGEVKFLREIDPSVAAWKIVRDDFLLAPLSPNADRGPDLTPIPAAPDESAL
jgi:serine/threonine protein kinase